MDRTVYTDANALAISAYLEAYGALGGERYLEVALRALDFLWERCFQPGRGMFHYWDGEPHLPGLLADQVGMAGAFLDAYQATGDKPHLNRAHQLAQIVAHDFYGGQAGAFFDFQGSGEGQANLRSVPFLDDNALAARLFTRLSFFGSNGDYRRLAERSLQAFAPAFTDYGIQAAGYALAVTSFLNEPLQATVVGPRHHPEVERFLKGLLKVYEPHKVVRLLDPEADAAAMAQAGYADGAPTAYICLGQACAAPLRQARGIKAAIAQLQKAGRGG